MSESLLKKQFRESDVQRIRNLVKGKTGDKTKVLVGYEKEYVHRQEGDIWEEDSKTWTIKNGVKQTISKLQKARELSKQPLFCPECKTLMKHRYDSQFYVIHKRCFNCQVSFETELKRTGKWEEYQKEIHNSEIDNMVRNYEVWVEDLINESTDTFITEAGELESWGKVNVEKIKQQRDEAIEYLTKLRK